MVDCEVQAVIKDQTIIKDLEKQKKALIAEIKEKET